MVYNCCMDTTDPLDLFLPPVREWFRSTLGEPTPAQRLGWPAIAAGQNTLILAPTGSGKTLAAFLACLDGLWRQGQLSPGVRVLYISPLKALNNDIHRNLQVPLEGVAAVGPQLGQPLPVIESAVRTGDTPTSERQRLVRRPPHVLITTPESLHLLLTSRARDTLRHVTHCIIDEIHALCPNKRGVFLALLLERLRSAESAGLRPHRPVRDAAAPGRGRPLPRRQEIGTDGTQRQRPVTIVDAGLRSDLDLRVVCPVENFGPLPEKSVWPSIYRLLREEIGRHRSTIVFANNRRSVERITAQLNGEGDDSDWHLRGEPSVMQPPPLEGLARAHHGSVALEVRQRDGTGPEGRSLARGRGDGIAGAGHRHGRRRSGLPGRIARQRRARLAACRPRRARRRPAQQGPAHPEDAAGPARTGSAGPRDGRRPRRGNPLSAELPRRAGPAGRRLRGDGAVGRAGPVLAPGAPSVSVPRPDASRVRGRPGDGQWPLSFRRRSRTTSRSATATRSAPCSRASAGTASTIACVPLPGSQQLALVNGGTIPDTGQYGAYTASGVRIGELDEEFVYERRIGDAFLLGTNAWRVERIEADRVLVAPAEGAPAMLPFWRGENVGRTFDLGRAIGAFLRELLDRLDAPDCQRWLQEEHFLDANAARSLQASRSSPS